MTLTPAIAPKGSNNERTTGSRFRKQRDYGETILSCNRGGTRIDAVERPCEEIYEETQPGDEHDDQLHPLGIQSKQHVEFFVGKQKQDENEGKELKRSHDLVTVESLTHLLTAPPYHYPRDLQRLLILQTDQGVRQCHGYSQSECFRPSRCVV